MEKKIGSTVAFHRKKAGLSQFALAKLAGVGKTTVFDIEKGKPTVQMDTLLKVLSALNIFVQLNGPLMKEFERSVIAGSANEKS